MVTPNECAIILSFYVLHCVAYGGACYSLSFIDEEN